MKNVSERESGRSGKEEESDEYVGEEMRKRCEERGGVVGRRGGREGVGERER